PHPGRAADGRADQDRGGVPGRRLSVRRRHGPPARGRGPLDGRHRRRRLDRAPRRGAPAASRVFVGHALRAGSAHRSGRTAASGRVAREAREARAVTRWRASLAAKALGLQLAGLLAIAVVVGAARYYAIRHQLYRQVEGSAEALAQVLEDLLAEHPELMHTASLDPVVERFSRKLPAVARVSVVDPAGVIVADSRASEGRPTEQPEAQPLLTKVGEMRSSYTQR